jgi:hypothetical protein
MKFNRLLLVIFLLRGIGLHAQSADHSIREIDGSTALKEIGTLPQHIKEASGLEMTAAGNLWTHNDGGLPMLFCIDPEGTVKRSLQLNHKNAGWEDLTQDDEGNFYVGAFGNNKNDKRELKIYKLPNPDSISENVFTAEIIKYHYADQKNYPAADAAKNFDVDAFTAIGDSLYLFTKNRTKPFTGYTKIYGIPQSPGSYDINPIDSLYLGDGPMIDNWVTGADVSPDGKMLVLLSHQCLWIIKNFHGKKFSEGKIVRVNLNHLSHKAGICFKNDNELYIVDELELGFLGGKVYSYDLKQLYNKLQ